MIGDYVRWYGQLAKIMNESFGLAEIKIKNRSGLKEANLCDLKPVRLRVAREIRFSTNQIDGESSKGRTSDFGSGCVGSNPTSPTNKS